jgi:PBP1b-binding outer membrane lipoprotein LpoB
MKQLHLTGKLACALIITAAFISGCKKKDADVPPPVPEATPAPAVTPAPATPPATEGTPTAQPDPNAPPAATTPPATTEPPPAPPANR